MACKYIYNNVEYKDNQTFIEEFVKPNFINQPKTLRLQELQQPDFLKFIRKDKNYLKSQGLTNEEVDFLNLLFAGDEKWVTFFIKSVIQDAAKKGYEKVLFPKGDTAAKIEGHQTLEEFKRQKENRIKKLETEKSIINKPYKIGDYFDKTVNNLPENERIGFNKIETQEEADIVNKEIIFDKINNIDNEINQLKQELERIEKEGFGALRPIYKFYEETVGNILKKQFKDQIQEVTDEYGNQWLELKITPEQATEAIKFQSPKLEYSGDLAIEEKIAKLAEISKDEKIPTNKLEEFIQWVKNLLRSLYKERDKIDKLIRDLNQGKFKYLQKNIKLVEDLYERAMNLSDDIIEERIKKCE